MNRRSILFVLSVLVLTIAVAGTSEDVTANHNNKLEVTITNLTKGQVFSPPIVATHHRRLAPLFELGAEASVELAALAEDGMTGPLEMLWNDPLVKDVKTGDFIMPGHSATIEVRASYGRDYLTLASMLVNSNDAFFALNGVRAPKSGWKTYLSPAYDAGSENNNELCTHVPGPACGAPGGAMRDIVGAEGYVYIHSGIHGIEDLASSEYNWHNPVAKITVRRMR